MKKVFTLIFCFGFFFGKAQEIDSSKVHFTISFGTGLCGILENSHAGNVFFNKYFSQASIGFRKEFLADHNFMSFLLTYTNRGVRQNQYQGNSFLPDSKMTYDEKYLAAQFSYGAYFMKSIYLKGSLCADFMISSDLKDLSVPRSFRGYYRFTPALEVAAGTDFKLGSTILGSIELFFGATFFKTRYYCVGPKLSFFFKEKDVELGFKK